MQDNGRRRSNITEEERWNITEEGRSNITERMTMQHNGRRKDAKSRKKEDAT